jgi:hypothetical protein
MTPLGTESATFRQVTQDLNQLGHGLLPGSYKYHSDKLHASEGGQLENVGKQMPNALLGFTTHH